MKKLLAPVCISLIVLLIACQPIMPPTAVPAAQPTPMSTMASSSAIDLDPEDAFAYNNRGNAYSNQGDYEQAIADYTHAIDLDPEDATAYNNRGLAYSNQGDYEQAIADYTHAIDLDPEYATAYYNRGIAYREQGEYEQAIADYTQAIDLDPEYASAQPTPVSAMASSSPSDQVVIEISATNSAQVTNIEAEGNLQSLNNIGCTHPDSLRSMYTPPDLYQSTVECVKRKDYDASLYSSALAGVYARYDAMRVSDQTAHQAEIVVKIEYMSSLTNDQQNIFVERLSALAGSPDKFAAFCSDIRKIGPPTYHPTYMIQHGMGVFLGESGGNGLVSDFDSVAAWEKSLDTYLHCPKQ